ncbi:hypothetical protein [Roseateles chitosanitabidus]|uniref:hypothetical protein n=1 Tax=Roseateles chitosanitabidus TaxID=65048 RepID=UPI000832A430|nr:hypothetical protein [Roseateles chitosanitabidus]
MRSLLVVLFVAWASYMPSDVRSPKILPSVVYPLIFALSLIALVMWLYLWSRQREPDGHRDTTNWDIDFSDSHGGH